MSVRKTPRKLTERRQKSLEQTHQAPPTDEGIDAPSRTLAFLDEFLEQTFDVEYSLPAAGDW
jgi:hypothetical protein